MILLLCTYKIRTLHVVSNLVYVTCLKLGMAQDMVAVLLAHTTITRDTCITSFLIGGRLPQSCLPLLLLSVVLGQRPQTISEVVAWYGAFTMPERPRRGRLFPSS